MKTIQIQIDCDGEYCGRCIFQKYSHLYLRPVCNYFFTAQKTPRILFKSKDGLNIKRCQQCLDAEEKANQMMEYHPCIDDHEDD